MLFFLIFNGIRRVNGLSGECSVSFSEFEGISVMFLNFLVIEELGILEILVDDLEGIKIKVFFLRVRFNGSRYFVNWIISVVLIFCIVVFFLGGG